MLCLSDSSALSDNPQDIRSPLVRFFRLIGQPARHSLSACPILPPYRTTRKTFALRLSDSSALSDNPQDIRSPFVRFFHLIGQPARHSLSACPILPPYRTTRKTFALRLSDSPQLSDIPFNKHVKKKTSRDSLSFLKSIFIVRKLRWPNRTIFANPRRCSVRTSPFRS